MFSVISESLYPLIEQYNLENDKAKRFENKKQIVLQIFKLADIYGKEYKDDIKLRVTDRDEQTLLFKKIAKLQSKDEFDKLLIEIFSSFQL